MHRNLQFHSPIGNTSITLQDTMYIEVHANGPSEGAQFTLYNIREDKSFSFDESPFYITWHPKMDGKHGFYAKAEYPDGEVIESNTSTVDVESYTGRIKIQGDNSHFIQAGIETVIYLEIILAHPVIINIDYYLDSTLIASDSTFPFSIEHTFTQVGRFRLGATLTTDEGYPIFLERTIEIFER